MTGIRQAASSGWRWDVALSFAGAQQSYVMEVAAELKSRGVRCFYDADEQIDLWGKYLAEELPRIYADQAAAVVVFISAEYAARDWTRLERRSALNRAVRERREYVLPARFDDTDLPGLLSDMVAIKVDQVTPAGFADLIETKLIALGVRPPTPTDAAAPTPHRPAAWNVPGRLATFTGRDDLLETIHRQLTADGRVAVTGISAATALHGLGGVGKTQLAIEYAWRHAHDYSLVWWIDAEQASLIGERIAGLGVPLGLSLSGEVGQDAASVLAALRQRTDWLLIFDNVELAQDIQSWLPIGGNILITSRNPVWGGVATRIQVDMLARAETRLLLSRRVGNLDSVTADGLADELGDLPLAVEQAAAYLETTGLTPATYLERFRNSRGQMISRGRDLVYGGSVDTAWELTLDRLQQRTPAAVQLLQLCAHLGPHPIPLSLFREHHDILLTSGQAAVVASEVDFDDLIGILLSFSLARRDGDAIQVHRLVSAVVRAHQMPDAHQSTADTVCRLVTTAATSDPQDPTTWPTWTALGAHLLHLSASLGLEDRHHLRGTLAAYCWYLFARGDYNAARRLDTAHHGAYRVLLGDDHADTIAVAHNLGAVLSVLGEHETARALKHDVLIRRRRQLGPDHLTTLVSATNLAYDLRHLGQFEQARTLNEDTLDRLRRTVGDNHLDTLHTCHNLANDLSKLGEHEHARALNEDTLVRLREQAGGQHPDTLRVAGALANSLGALGDHEGARRLTADTLAKQQQVLGPDHHETLDTASCLAAHLTSLGYREAAQNLAEETLARQRRILGAAHSNTITTANLLADIMRTGTRAGEMGGRADVDGKQEPN